MSSAPPGSRPLVMLYGSFAPEGMPCGITSSVSSLVASPLQQTHSLQMVSTYREPASSRGALTKLAFGVQLSAGAGVSFLRHRVSLVDVHTASSQDFRKHAAIVLAARATRRPCLLRIHGGGFVSAFADAGPAERAFIRAMLRGATRVVALSDGWREALLRIEPRARVAVLPNSIDFEHFASLAERRPTSARGILLLGNLCRAKGHYDLLRAAVAVLSRYPDVSILLAGGDREPGATDDLRALAANLGIERNVRFLGPVFDAARDAAFMEAQVFVLPSHAENMPISIMEAMASRLPVVGTRVGAVPAMLGDGARGLLVEPSDASALSAALLELLDLPDRRAEIAKRGQEFAAESWRREAIGRATARLFDEVMGGR